MKSFPFNSVFPNCFGSIEQIDCSVFVYRSKFSQDFRKESPSFYGLERFFPVAGKAAVKGNMKLSVQEVDALIGELLSLDNPYHCPHGRPTIIAMTKRELEKKFKRIV